MSIRDRYHSYRDNLRRRRIGRDGYSQRAPAVGQATGNGRGILLRRLERSDRPNALDPVVADRVRQPQARLGLARRHGRNHAATDRLLCRPRHRLLGLRLVLSRGSQQGMCLQQRARSVSEITQPRPPPILSARGESPALSHRAERLGCLESNLDRICSASRLTCVWTASRC